MIPFWKKTDKSGKKKPPKPAVPRTAQQSIPMQRMFEDGTCRVKPNYYTRTIQYQDINYQLAQQEDKTAIFEEWCSFLNFFDSSIKFELSFVNMATDSTEFEKSIRIPFQKDGFDDVRAEYSQMLRQQLAKGNNGLTKTKFITFGVEGESMAQVKPRLDHMLTNGNGTRSFRIRWVADLIFLMEACRPVAPTVPAHRASTIRFRQKP